MMVPDNAWPGVVTRGAAAEDGRDRTDVTLLLNLNGTVLWSAGGGRGSLQCSEGMARRGGERKQCNEMGQNDRKK